MTPNSIIMRKRISTISFMLLCIGLSNSVFSQTQAGNGHGSTSDSKKEIPVILKKSNPHKEHLAPARKLSMTLSISNYCIYFSVPLQNYPLYVELEKTAPESGVWTSTLFQPEDCLENFDGTPGDYLITITDAEATVYTGEFTL